ARSERERTARLLGEIQTALDNLGAPHSGRSLGVQEVHALTSLGRLEPEGRVLLADGILPGGVATALGALGYDVTVRDLAEALADPETYDAVICTLGGEDDDTVKTLLAPGGLLVATAVDPRALSV